MPHGDLHGDSKPLVTPDSEEQEEKPKSKPKSKATNGKKANGAAGKAKKVSTVLCPSNSISDPAFELLGQTVKAEDVADDGDDRMQDIEEEVVKPPSSKQRKVRCRSARLDGLVGVEGFPGLKRFRLARYFSGACVERRLQEEGQG
jgi:hypothetical protein